VETIPGPAISTPAEFEHLSGAALWKQWCFEVDALLNRSCVGCCTQFSGSGRALRYFTLFSTIRFSIERALLSAESLLGCGSCVSWGHVQTSRSVAQSSGLDTKAVQPSRSRVPYRDRVTQVEALLRRNSSRDATVCAAAGSYAIVEGAVRNYAASAKPEKRRKSARTSCDDEQSLTGSHSAHRGSAPNQPRRLCSTLAELVPPETAPLRVGRPEAAAPQNAPLRAVSLRQDARCPDAAGRSNSADCDSRRRQSSVRVAPSTSQQDVAPNASSEAVKRYQCTECRSRFSRKYDMLRHVRSVHLGERNYPCELCNMAFQQAGHLEAHITVVHLNVRRFVCSECGDRFGNSSNLRSHMIYIHSEPRRSNAFSDS